MKISESVCAPGVLPREVYKEENKKRKNYPSRDDRVDADGAKVAARPVFWPEAVASDLMTFDSVICPQGQTAFGNVIAQPREQASRYSGISVQHVRTQRGVKVAIALQRPHWAEQGMCQLATAELKRWDRLREVRARSDDSDHFNQYLTQTRSLLQRSAEPGVCMGRLHQRGRRSQWIHDTLIVAFFEQDHMRRVMLYLEGEESVIEMDQPLSPAQQRYYLSWGLQGQLRSQPSVPRLADLPLVRFGATDA